MNDFADKQVRVEMDSSVALITLARPEKHNAFDHAMALDLHYAVRHVANGARGGAVRAIVLAAEGKVFSVGGDLAYFAETEDRSEPMRLVATALHDTVELLTAVPVPVVSAVHGVAAGAGVGLALAADIIVAGPDAKLRLAYTAGGLSPDCGATWILPRSVGMARAMDLALTNRAVDAVEAEKWGLISRLTDSDDVVGEALSIAKQLAAGPTEAFTATKHLMRTSQDRSFVTHLNSEAEAISRLVESPDGREGIDAFLTKRAPTFS